MHRTHKMAVMALIGLLWASPVWADLVTNGNFATGTFAGWTVSDPTGITVDSAEPYTGDTYDASLGSYEMTGTLSQTLATTPGTVYEILFAVQNQDSTEGLLAPTYTDLFQVSFGTGILFSSTGVLDGPGYNLYSFEDTATSSSTQLQFTDENDLSVWNLDNVSVMAASGAVPEPASVYLLLTALVLGLPLVLGRALHPRPRLGDACARGPDPVI